MTSPHNGTIKVTSSMIATPAELIPRIALSTFPLVIGRNYTHVLNLCLHFNPHESIPHDPIILQMPLSNTKNLFPYLPLIIAFLDTAMQDPMAKVLIHCASGANGSAAAIMAYICHENGVTADEAAVIMEYKAPYVQTPSRVYMCQIDQYFLQLKNRTPIPPLNTTLKVSQKMGIEGVGMDMLGTKIDGAELQAKAEPSEAKKGMLKSPTYQPHASYYGQGKLVGVTVKEKRKKLP